MDVFKKVKELLVDSTVGLIREYQTKSVDLVKLEATKLYIFILRLLRRQVLFFTIVLFLVVMVAAGIIIVPLVLLAIAPISREVKLILALLIGVADIGIPLFILIRFLSEEKWMEFTKSNELLESVMKK